MKQITSRLDEATFNAILCQSAWWNADRSHKCSSKSSRKASFGAGAQLITAVNEANMKNLHSNRTPKEKKNYFWYIIWICLGRLELGLDGLRINSSKRRKNLIAIIMRSQIVKISDCFIYLNKLSDLLMLPFKMLAQKERVLITLLGTHFLFQNILDLSRSCLKNYQYFGKDSQNKRLEMIET